MGLIVMCIADAGSRVSLTGGPYAYVGTAFGAYAGFLAGVLLWMLGIFATAAVATVFAASVGLLVPALAASCKRSCCLWRLRSGRSSTCAASGWRTVQLDRDSCQATAAAARRDRRAVLRASREPAR